MEKLKLTVATIPLGAANLSLNQMLSCSQWERIRKDTYRAYNYRCGICGIEPRAEPIVRSELLDPEKAYYIRWLRKRRLECHEVWEYDDTAHIQKLAGLVALCSRCHQIKHWGWASGGATGWRQWQNEEEFMTLMKMNAEEGISFLEEHFMEVNDCDLATLREHVKWAGDLWIHRSQYEWKIDFGEYTPSLEDQRLAEALTASKSRVNRARRLSATFQEMTGSELKLYRADNTLWQEKHLAHEILINDRSWRRLPRWLRKELRKAVGKGNIVDYTLADVESMLWQHGAHELYEKLLDYVLCARIIREL